MNNFYHPPIIGINAFFVGFDDPQDGFWVRWSGSTASSLTTVHSQLGSESCNHQLGAVSSKNQSNLLREKQKYGYVPIEYEIYVVRLFARVKRDTTESSHEAFSHVRKTVEQVPFGVYRRLTYSSQKDHVC